jgi:hypothetical protein
MALDAGQNRSRNFKSALKYGGITAVLYGIYDGFTYAQQNGYAIYPVQDTILEAARKASFVGLFIPLGIAGIYIYRGLKNHQW